MPDLLVEVGCEELPSSACREIIEQAPGLFSSSLEALGLAVPGSVELSVAPRRFALVAPGLPEGIAATARRVRGPSEEAAFGDDGAPTRAAEGFARGQGVAVGDLVVARGERPPLRVRRAPRGGPAGRRARARGGGAPDRGPALLEDHALGRRDRPALLAPGALDRREGRRAHGAIRAARPGRGRRQPGPPLPGRPGRDPVGGGLPRGARGGGGDRRPRAAPRAHRVRPRRGGRRGRRHLARPGRQARRGRLPGRVAERRDRAASTRGTWRCPRACW